MEKFRALSTRSIALTARAFPILCSWFVAMGTNLWSRTLCAAPFELGVGQFMLRLNDV